MTAMGTLRLGLSVSPGQLDALVEAEVGEDDPRGCDRAQDAVPALRFEAVEGEVRTVECGEEERQNDQHDDGQLPPHQCGVDPREPTDAEVVDHHEQRHQAHGGDVAQRGKRVYRLARGFLLDGERSELGGVVQRREYLDRRRRAGADR
jgi:hypothetical protein